VGTDLEFSVQESQYSMNCQVAAHHPWLQKKMLQPQTKKIWNPLAKTVWCHLGFKLMGVKSVYIRKSALEVTATSNPAS
jgi:hypothetical protein